MGSFLTKPVDPSAPLVPAIPIPVLPASHAFILFNIGGQFASISNDLWLKQEFRKRKNESRGDASLEMQHDDPVFQAVAAFYNRKAIRTPLFQKISVLLPLLLGTLSNFRALYYALFIKNGSHGGKRKFYDILGFFLFVANVLYAAKVVIPWERRMGSLWNGPKKENKGVSTTLSQRERISTELLKTHLTSLSLFVALLVQTALSWKADTLVQARSLSVKSGAQ